MNKLFQITSSAKNSQIKDELQLKDLNEAVNLYSQSLMSMRKKEKKEQIIKNLEEEVFVMKKKVENISSWFMGQLKLMMK